MSLNCQLVLPGHPDPTALADMFSKLHGVIEVRASQRYRPEHWELHVVTDNGSALLDAFLSSWAKEDYAQIYTGESVLLTGPTSPLVEALFVEAAKSRGGFMRKHEQADWVIA